MTRILFADDDAIIRRVVEVRLRKEGFDVTVADGGRQALELLGLANGSAKPSGGFEMVLSDQMMPGISGLDVLKRIREVASPSEMPVIMVTAKGRTEDIVEALGAGANDYVTKPIDFGVLLARIATHLDLKRAHLALRESHRSLVHAARMESVGHLAAGVAHEIRNPLAQIQMGLDGVRQMFAEDNPNLAEMLGMIEQAVGRADEIIMGLVSASSEARLQLARADLNTFVADSLDLLAEELDDAGVGIVIELAESEPTALLAHDELQQVFLAVMLNAMQAMAGNGTIVVRTAERVAEGLPHEDGGRTGAFVRNGDLAGIIEIEDEGTGIAPEDLERVFDPFFTGRSTGQGRGLGLTIARKWMELHGGALLIRNREDGKGVIVTLMLRSQETGML